MSTRELGTKIRQTGVSIACLSFLLLFVAIPATSFNIWAPSVSAIVGGWTGLLIGLIGLIVQNKGN